MNSSTDNQQVESHLQDSDDIQVEPKMSDQSLRNILLMSVSFLLIFTAFNSSSLIQIPVVLNINKEGLHWNAYGSLATIYGVFSFANFLVPSILSVVSSARCLFFSSLTYLAYTIVFIWPIEHMLYVVSVILGFGAAVIWTAQANYLTENSDHQTIDRNTGVFWAIFQGSLVFGNLFLYFKFNGKPQIDQETRKSTYGVLSVICAVGCFLLIFLPRKTSRTITADSALDQSNPITAFQKCLKLFKTNKMLLLSLACFYSGLELSLYGSVYPAVISHTCLLDSRNKTILDERAFCEQADTHKYIGIYGFCVGIGSIMGGLIFGLSGKRFVKNNRSRVFILGFILHILAYFLIFLNHPDAAALKLGSAKKGIIEPRVWIVLLNGLLLGFGDACFNTQIISLIGCVYTQDSNYTSSAFALYKFTQSIGAASSFFLSSMGESKVSLYPHLSILVVFSMLGTFAFVMVELFVKKENE